MKQHHFNRSKLAKLMTFDDYLEIEKAYLEYVQITYPNYPENRITDVSDRLKGSRPSNTLQNCIVRYLLWTGNQAEQINTTGTYRKGIGWTPSGSTKGSADISATVKGRSVKIEVKIGRDVQSEAQQKYQNNIERAGGIYWIVKTFTEFLIKYKTL